MNQRISQSQLESYLWGAAVHLRGTIDAGDYKQFIFPLLFYKRLCDVFVEETQAALDESGGDATFATYPENHRFQVPEAAHWRAVRQVATNVGQALQSAMRAIESANQERLYGIFGDAQWTNKDRLPDSMLRDLMEHFSTLDLTLANLPEDELGQGYEYLIKKFADDSGHTAAEFYTNRTVVHLMTEMLQPQPGESIYDPTCGSGGMLLSSIAHLRRQAKEWRNVRLYGQERNLMTSSIARMNCFLHGIEDFQIMRGDTLTDPKLVEGDRLKQFDLVLANPPYSIKQWDRAAFETDKWGRNRFGTPPQGRADYAFWQHIIYSMKPETGRCAILFPHGVLFRQEEAEMRRKMIEADMIECVLGLGPNLFYNSSMEACIVICRINKPDARRGKILLINALSEVTRERSQSFVTQEHIDHIAGAYHAFHDEGGFCRVVSLQEIREKDHNLKIDLYVTSPVSDLDSQGENDFAEALEKWSLSASNVRGALSALLPETRVAEEQRDELAVTVTAGLRAFFGSASWPRVRFGDVVRCCKETIDPTTGELDRYIAGEHMISENVHLTHWGTVGDGYLGPAFIRRFRKGQVLYGSRRTYLKKVAYAEFDGITANTTFVLEGEAGRLFQPLLPWLMLSQNFTDHSVRESKGSTNPYINFSDIAKFEFALPPLDHQKQIADILWTVDEVVTSVRSAVEQTAQLRKTYLQTTFDRAKAMYPGVSIKDTGLVQLGRQRAPKYQVGVAPKPYLRVANVFDGYMDYQDVLQMDFDDRDFSTYRLQKGDVLLNEGQSRELVGRCAIYDGAIVDCCFQNTLIRYRAGDGVLTDYAFTFFQHCFYSGVFSAIASQTTSVAHLGADRFAALLMPMPPKAVQAQIAGKYLSIKRAEAQLSDHLATVLNLRQTLLDSLVE